jgi:allantoinase
LKQIPHGYCTHFQPNNRLETTSAFYPQYLGPAEAFGLGDHVGSLLDWNQAMRTRFIDLRISTGDNTTEAVEIVVDDGRIEEILPPATATASGDEQWISFDDALVLPGAIDGHVHFNDPGFTYREDFASGTSAAAAGGVTCGADMPCTSLPPITTSDALENKLKAITPKAHVDFLLWGGVSANAMESSRWRDNLNELVDAGAAAIKVYTLSGMNTFRDLSTTQIKEILSQTRRLGIPVGVHAEDRDIVRQLTERAELRGEDSPQAYAATRPAAAEASAVTAVVEACRSTGARIHIVHLAAGEALDVVSAARFENLPVTAETCPQYLEFTIRDLELQGSILKTAPVVKGTADRERLWQGLASGELSFVTTDHAAGRWPEEKETGSIWSDYGGVPGVELMLPYLYSEGFCAGRITLQRLIEITASEPARFFGIDHRKGRLHPGFDADFVVFDEAARWTVRAESLHNLNRYTPLEGREFTGRVRASYLRGQCVYQRNPDGSESFARAGTGEWVRRGLT